MAAAVLNFSVAAYNSLMSAKITFTFKNNHTSISPDQAFRDLSNEDKEKFLKDAEWLCQILTIKNLLKVK